MRYRQCAAISFALLWMMNLSGTAQPWSTNLGDALRIFNTVSSFGDMTGTDQQLVIPVTSHPCQEDTSPPAAPGNLKVTRISVHWQRTVGLITDPTLSASNNSRSGQVKFAVQDLSKTPFDPACSGSSNLCTGADQYVIEEATDSNFSIGVTEIARQPFQWTNSSAAFGPFVRPFYGERRYYRVKFLPGGTKWGGCVLKTPSMPVDILRKVEVLIRNQLSVTNPNDIYSDSKLVRIRLAGTSPELKSGGRPPEQLSSDSPGYDTNNNTVCAAGKGQEISPGNSQTYTLDDGYVSRGWIHIGMGDWITMGSINCGSTTWEKRAYYESQGTQTYRYFAADLSQCFGLNSITFVSSAGNLNPNVNRANPVTPSCALSNLTPTTTTSPPVDRYLYSP